MAPMASPKYTLVQHSAAVRAGDETFSLSVELRSIFGKQILDVAKAGGLIFNSYAEAAEAEEEENYPPGVEGMVPRVVGSFSEVMVDRMPVYVPGAASAETSKDAAA